MEGWKKRHPHTFINIMSKELLRSLEENDLTQSKKIGNEIQALNTVAEENHKKLENDFAKLKTELEDAKAKIERLETDNKDHYQEIEASESFVKLQNDFDEAVTKLQEKDTTIGNIETQIEDFISKIKNSGKKFESDLDQRVQNLLVSERKLPFAQKNIENMTKLDQCLEKNRGKSVNVFVSVPKTSTTQRLKNDPKVASKIVPKITSSVNSKNYSKIDSKSFKTHDASTELLFREIDNIRQKYKIDSKMDSKNESKIISKIETSFFGDGNETVIENPKAKQLKK